MSAMGQKRPPFTAPFYDRFTPESGHLSAWGGRNYFEDTPPIKSLPSGRSHRRIVGPLARLARNTYRVNVGSEDLRHWLTDCIP